MWQNDYRLWHVFLNEILKDEKTWLVGEKKSMDTVSYWHQCVSMEIAFVFATYSRYSLVSFAMCGIVVFLCQRETPFSENKHLNNVPLNGNVLTSARLTKSLSVNPPVSFSVTKLWDGLDRSRQADCSPLSNTLSVNLPWITSYCSWAFLLGRFLQSHHWHPCSLAFRHSDLFNILLYVSFEL